MIKRFLQSIRLFPHKREESFFLIKELLGFTPVNLDLYRLACIHKSSSIIDKSGNVLNNERLEYLGDAILDAIIADVLYQRYPDRKEGFLTNARSKIVNRTSLNDLAIKTNLNSIIISTASDQSSNIFGNAFEAFIGAVYLDLGYKKCKYFIENRIIDTFWDIDQILMDETNFKSRLLEWCQKNKKRLDFVVLEENTDNLNNTIFVSQAKVDEEPLGRGAGSTKKESQQQAAKEALYYLDSLR